MTRSLWAPPPKTPIRKRIQILDVLKERRKFWELMEEAEDRSGWLKLIYEKIKLSAPDRDSNPDIHDIDCLVYCENDALEHSSPEASSLQLGGEAKIQSPARSVSVSWEKVADYDLHSTYDNSIDSYTAYCCSACRQEQ
uniref:Uncharacterized protein n=1 Tax=Timema bartmani TaxID=61472 RepID=A0A7R9ETN4_9NEOP|nr:unnamed protein product [Timema bartmani]